MIKNFFLSNRSHYILIVLLIFFTDRYFKNTIINLNETINNVDIMVTNFLNIYLVWNKGIAFGFLSFDSIQSYNFVTIIICIVNLIIIYLIYSSKDYKGFLYSLILGGSLGNLYDRFYYNAVPDYIDLHIKDFHWFIFNIADIFITLGVMCLIFVEIFLNKSVNDK
jgi:signal peptidase II